MPRLLPSASADRGCGGRGIGRREHPGRILPCPANCRGLVCSATRTVRRAGGLSVREIQAHLLELYGGEVSPDLISRVTDAVLAEVRGWQKRPLDRSTR